MATIHGLMKTIEKENEQLGIHIQEMKSAMSDPLQLHILMNIVEGKMREDEQNQEEEELKKVGLTTNGDE